MDGIIQVKILRWLVKKKYYFPKTLISSGCINRHAVDLINLNLGTYLNVFKG